MLRDDLNRRDFHKLTAAALGGMMTGTTIGCGGGDGGKPGDKGTKPADKGATPAAKTEEVAWMGDIHICRGLNACKGKGLGGTNACAGQGACATAKAHTCHAENDCKFQGGCGNSFGTNACKGKGECGVPIAPDTWKKARAAFEAAMNKAEKKFGDAPAAAPEAPKGEANKGEGAKEESPKTNPEPAKE